ncbi:hypothetical protein PIB30_048864 [Stylosanthes scabra]|uniref:DUF4283 domain-containing protein n=1 Tax=Stylosanthes scabra TaxID=79078 RepID=A0ABU6YIY2_9FABA|nr:hypothetical protein [Stylosanthes scabra]
MGSMKLLMTFDTVANMEEAEKSCYLFNHFIEVRRRTTGEVNRVRRKWLEVTGLPAHGWMQENMMKIGEVWGKVILIQDDNGKHFNSFRVLVDSNVGPGIQDLASVVIEGECFQIFVKEVGDVVPWMVEDETAKDRGEQNNWQMGISREEASAEEDEVSKLSRKKRLCVDNSPTKTVTLEDDRRTEEVIQEWEDSCFHLLVRNVGPSGEMEDNAEEHSLGLNHDTSSSSLSAPPGFEHGRETSSSNMKNIPERVRGRSRERKRGKKKQSRKMSLKLIDQVKERARRKKEEHKKKIGKQKQARVTEIEGDARESEEEIEATESDEEDTWWVGTRSGLRAESEEGAKKYLKSKE